MSQATIFYIEDDADIRDLALYALRQAGFAVRGFPDAEGFTEACAASPPDLILLDIMLPGVDGMEMLGRIRQDEQLRDIPVMMLTAKGTELDKVRGLDAGADDYLAKPFGMMELISRVNALLRRSSRAGVPDQRDVLARAGVTLDRRARTAMVDGVPLDLTFKEFELLATLMSNAGCALSRAQLFEAVWGSAFMGNTRTVDVHMQTLRQKMDRASAGSGASIETVRGVGYRLRADREQTR